MKKPLFCKIAGLLIFLAGAFGMLHPAAVAGGGEAPVKTQIVKRVNPETGRPYFSVVKAHPKPHASDKRQRAAASSEKPDS